MRKVVIFCALLLGCVWILEGQTQISAPSPINVQNIGGSAVSTAATGVQKVGVTGNAGAAFDAADAAAPPANDLAVAGLVSGATGGLLGKIPICDQYKVINVVTATTTLLVTGVASRQVRICEVNIVLAATGESIAWVEGTGATCATGIAGLSGGTTAAAGWVLPASAHIDIGNGVGTVMKTATAGDSVCLITGTAIQLSGGLSYAIY